MAAIEYTPPGERNESKWPMWIDIAAPIIVIAGLIALVGWVATTPSKPNPHAGMVCVRETQRLLPYTSTDLWGNTTTRLMNQTQCREWQKVIHE